MELRHLRYFVAVAEEGHYTRAAERLGIKQPPLSQQIHALEAELGFALFRRHPKGAELTTGGRAFLDDARALLSGVTQAAARGARAANGIEGALCIGFTSSAAAHPLIPRIVRAYRAAWPGIDLSFREGNAAELSEAIQQRTIDAAFLRLPVTAATGMTCVNLVEEEMLLVLPAGHRLLPASAAIDQPTIQLQALAGESFILVRRHGAPGLYSNFIKACERSGFTPRIALEVEHMLTNICLVAAGAGISVVPASMRGFHEESVVYCRLPQGVPGLMAPLTLMHPDADGSPARSQFLTLVERCLGEFLAVPAT